MVSYLLRHDISCFAEAENRQNVAAIATNDYMNDRGLLCKKINKQKLILRYMIYITKPFSPFMHMCLT